MVSLVEVGDEVGGIATDGGKGGEQGWRQVGLAGAGLAHGEDGERGRWIRRLSVREDIKG
jgi:hypothetical protein